QGGGGGSGGGGGGGGGAAGTAPARRAAPRGPLAPRGRGGRGDSDLDRGGAGPRLDRGPPHLAQQLVRGAARGEISVAQAPGPTGGRARVAADDDRDPPVGRPRPAENLAERDEASAQPRPLLAAQRAPGRAGLPPAPA